MTKQIADLMKKLDITEAEAVEMLEADKRIDKGEALFELSAEQKKVEKKMRQADRDKTVYKFTQRERKADIDKRTIISALEEMLSYSDLQAENTVISNPERQIDFVYNGSNYSVTLVKHRPPKE